MDTKSKATKKFWKPPSFEDFNMIIPTKKIKLDVEEIIKEPQRIPTLNETYEPKIIEDLAIHPKKIEEVRNWLRWSQNEKAPILLVTGPAGSGKTATVKVVAGSEGFSIKEWINPMDKTDYKLEGMVQDDVYDRFTFSETKQTDKFEDFIFKSSRYNSLFDKTDNTLILVEDVPNIFVWKPKLFHEFLEKYKKSGKSPIAFIVTDDQSLNLHNSLFPNSVKNKCNLTNIKFNPVNHSALIKNLKSLSDFCCSETVSTQFLENICKNSNGDLRSATSELLLFLRSNNQIAKPAKKPKKKLKKTEGLGAGSQPLSSKDTNFDFYHVLGRILYPKLLSENEKMEDNPNRIFVHDVHQIAENWSPSFLGVLHENYLQTFGKFHDVVKGAECFSFCDILGQHQELEGYYSLVGVIDLMTKNTQPKKTGFNPIKKSVSTNSNKFGNVHNGTEYMSSRDVLLDLMPFLKITEKDRMEAVSSSAEGRKDDEESDEDVIEIEEFDD